MKSRGYRLAAIAAAALLVTGGLVSPALADAPDLTTQTLNPGAEETCTVAAYPQYPGQDPETVPEPVVECFDNAAEALEHVTGETITNEAALAGDADALREIADEYSAQQQEQVGARTAAAAKPLLGLAFRTSNLSGTDNRILWGASGTGCYGGATYGFPNTGGALLINNNISSMASYAGCWSTLYDVTYYAGARINCTPTCLTMGSMDNRTSSIVMRPAGTLG